MTTKISQTCPFCNAEVEEGCVLGTTSIGGAFRWFSGEPTLAKNVFGTFMAGFEELGKIDKVFAGPYLRGFRCTRCRKVILDY